ncbi:MAG: SDR family NAD(P)-dependent oxidoreductase [Aggregatilineales bacterium]
MTRTALITGASRGLGLALAQRLAQDGWTLIINARGADALEHARRELAKVTHVSAIAGSIDDKSHRAQLANAVADAGGLDLLVNNAGILGPSPQPTLLEYPLDVLEDVFRTNVIAQLGIIQAVHGQLKPHARLINISSDAGAEAYAGWGGYGASKAALEHLSAILGEENPDLNIYWVDPGDMRTQMHQEAFPGEDISDRPLAEDSVPGLMTLIDGNFPGGRYNVHTIGQSHIDELRIVLTTHDLDGTLGFYQDALGLPVTDSWDTPEGRGFLLDSGRARLELIDATQAQQLDEIEVGERTAGPVRLAFEVSDIIQHSAQVTGNGTQAISPIRDVPWGHRNQRLIGPDNQQITLFQVIADSAEPQPES